jgi:TonB family protein
MSFSYKARVAGLSLAFLFLPSDAHSGALQAASTQTVPSTTAAPVRTDIVPPGKNMTAPILLHSVEPQWPAVAQRLSTPQTVILSCYIERDGTISNVHLVRMAISSASSRNDLVAKSFEDSAIEAVKQYRYKPAKKDGKPVPVELIVNVTFQR